MVKELERAGITTVLITSLTNLAAQVGAHRLVKGIAITNPVGNPDLPGEEEYRLRLRVLEKALESLQSEVVETKIAG